jgi:hypothetical protein
MLITPYDVALARIRIAARRAATEPLPVLMLDAPVHSDRRPECDDVDCPCHAASHLMSGPQSHQNARVGDYAVSCAADVNGVYWLWLFERTLTAEQVAEFCRDKAQVGRTARFTYYRLWRSIGR